MDLGHLFNLGRKSGKCNVIQGRLTCAVSSGRIGSALFSCCPCQSRSPAMSFDLSGLKAFPAEVSGCLGMDNGQSVCSNCLFLLFLGAQEISEHRASVQKDVDPGNLIPVPWSRVTERFSCSIEI